jgi:hypothetical protein
MWLSVLGAFPTLWSPSCPSFRRHETTRDRLKGFPWHLLLKCVTGICQQIKILLEWDNNDGKFMQTPTCVPARKNTWEDDPQTNLVAVVIFVSMDNFVN